MNDLYIYSGKCLIGKVGDETNFIDSQKQPLFVGDIVIFHHETSEPQFSVVCSDKYQSYSNGTYKENETYNAFVMGIRSVDFEDDNSPWHVTKVKDYQDLVDGEHWKNFGFSVSTLTQDKQS